MQLEGESFQQSGICLESLIWNSLLKRHKVKDYLRNVDRKLHRITLIWLIRCNKIGYIAGYTVLYTKSVCIWDGITPEKL